MKDIGELVGLLAEVRRRTLTNSFVRSWTRWCAWILLALLIAFLSSPVLAAPVALAVAMLAVAALAAGIHASRRHRSLHHAARAIDSAAGLEDRISTALVLSEIPSPDDVTLRQRQDALDKAARLNARALFPIRFPAEARRAAVLCLLLIPTFLYRVHHGPPIPAARASAAVERIAAAVIPPQFRPQMKKKDDSLAGRELAEREDRELPTGSSRSANASATSSSDSSKPDSSRKDAQSSAEQQKRRNEGEQQAGSEEQKQQQQQNGQSEQSNAGQSRNASGQQQAGRESNESHNSGEQSASNRQSQSPQAQGQQQQNGDSQQAGSDSQQQARGNRDQSSSQNSASNSAGQQASNQAGARGNQSLAQTVMQALKDLMSNASGQKPSQSSEQRAQASQSQSGQPHSQPGQQKSSPSGNSSQQQMASAASGQSGQTPPSSNSSGSDSQAKDDQPGSGVGHEAGNREMRDNPDLPIKTVAERVQLASADAPDGPDTRSATGPGNAQVPLTDAAPRRETTTNGAEQDSVPARYLQYIERYFDRAKQDARGHDSGASSDGRANSRKSENNHDSSPKQP